MRQRYSDCLAQAKEILSGHLMREAPSRSYRFTRPHGGSTYAYTLTWVPGSLSITGDIDELVLTHHNAMRTFEHALRWAVDAHYSYLMEKSDKSHEYDPDGTFEDIVRMANEGPLEALRGSSRIDRATGRMFWAGGYRRELQEWRRELAEREAEGLLPAADIEPVERPIGDPRATAALANLRPGERFNTQLDPCWHVWLMIRHIVVPHRVSRVGDPMDYAPTMVLKSRGRRLLKELIADEVRDRVSGAEFCSRLELDDYSGRYAYNTQTILQIEAIQHGCRMILDSMAASCSVGSANAEI